MHFGGKVSCPVSKHFIPRLLLLVWLPSQPYFCRWCMRLPILQGKSVVRLKGGCVSTFSRVSSEVASLAAAGLAYEMVPGVSSATAAPVLAGRQVGWKHTHAPQPQRSSRTAAAVSSLPC